MAPVCDHASQMRPDGTCWWVGEWCPCIWVDAGTPFWPAPSEFWGYHVVHYNVDFKCSYTVDYIAILFRSPIYAVHGLAVRAIQCKVVNFHRCPEIPSGYWVCLLLSPWHTEGTILSTNQRAACGAQTCWHPSRRLGTPTEEYCQTSTANHG